MRKFNSITLIVLIHLLFPGGGFAQDNKSNNISIIIPEVALLSLQSVSPGGVYLSPKAPGEAGLALDFTTSRTGEIWVNYSSVAKSRSQQMRHLDVAMDGKLPDGIRLKLAASPDAGFGKGKVGVPANEITLNEKRQEIITAIGSCYTGSGSNKGHRLTYTLVADDEDIYSEILAGDLTVRVTFTLSDEG